MLTAPSNLLRPPQSDISIRSPSRGVEEWCWEVSKLQLTIVSELDDERSSGIPGAALGPQINEKRRLTLEDVERRFRRSATVFGNY